MAHIAVPKNWEGFDIESDTSSLRLVAKPEGENVHGAVRFEGMNIQQKAAIFIWTVKNVPGLGPYLKLPSKY